jgi:hypothetical protein
MAIQGTYTKDGETVELITNGLTEILPDERPIKHIAMVAKKRRPRRRVDGMSIPNAVVFGTVIGMCGGLMVMELLDGHGVVRIWAGLALTLGSAWLYVNYFRKEVR